MCVQCAGLCCFHSVLTGGDLFCFEKFKERLCFMLQVDGIACVHLVKVPLKSVDCPCISHIQWELRDLCICFALLLGFPLFGLGSVFGLKRLLLMMSAAGG